MSVVSEISGRAGVRRPVSLELGAIAVMWVLLFAAAYSLASGAGSHAGVPTSALATGSPVDATAVVGGSAQAKHPSLVALASVPGAPALKVAPAPPKRKRPAPAVVSRPATVTPVVRVTPPPVTTTVTPVVRPPVTVTPSGGSTHHTSSGGGSSSSSQSGTGTVSGGG